MISSLSSSEPIAELLILLFELIISVTSFIRLLFFSSMLVCEIISFSSSAFCSRLGIVTLNHQKTAAIRNKNPII